MRGKISAVFALIIFTTSLVVNATSDSDYPFPVRPDGEVTPGSICRTQDGDFSEYRYPENIPYCQRNVSNSVKRRIYENYGIPEKCRRDYTIDHAIPLAVGGDNTDENLWPEHKAIKQLRYDLEVKVYADLKDGRISQKKAIRTIVDAKKNPPLDELGNYRNCN